ncbi:unnamed protein product [Protopolystoma xenopodis]|uniref:Amino acid transporter transmembrane domain-containing protein n=1 Tax=Protopolystoma xenopodis TaxID=117903 RepID=A0A3S5AFI4_9PLAT|nr:unnamed protein product [Protopolystoma xenopodis]
MPKDQVMQLSSGPFEATQSPDTTQVSFSCNQHDDTLAGLMDTGSTASDVGDKTLESPSHPNDATDLAHDDTSKEMSIGVQAGTASLAWPMIGVGSGASCKWASLSGLLASSPTLELDSGLRHALNQLEPLHYSPSLPPSVNPMQLALPAPHSKQTAETSSRPSFCEGGRSVEAKRLVKSQTRLRSPRPVSQTTYSSFETRRAQESDELGLSASVKRSRPFGRSEMALLQTQPGSYRAKVAQIPVSRLFASAVGPTFHHLADSWIGSRASVFASGGVGPPMSAKTRLLNRLRRPPSLGMIACLRDSPGPPGPSLNDAEADRMCRPAGAWRHDLHEIQDAWDEQMTGLGLLQDAWQPSITDLAADGLGGPDVCWRCRAEETRVSASPGGGASLPRPDDTGLGDATGESVAEAGESDMESSRLLPSALTHSGHENAERSSSVWVAGWNVTNLIQGIGILGVPYACVGAGWMSIPVIIAVAMICCFTGRLLAECLYQPIGEIDKR